ncbi:MAG: glycosyltransferase [bacterium]
MRKKLFLLIYSDSIGGAERRFARFWDYISAKNKYSNVYLLINRNLLEKLNQAELIKKNKNLIVLPSLFSKYFVNYKENSSKLNKLCFLITKLDILIGSAFTLFYLIRFKPNIVHLILAGVYVFFPFIYLFPGKTIISYPTINLSALTGDKLGSLIYLFSLKKVNLIDILSPSSLNELLNYGIKSYKMKISPGSFTDPDIFKPIEPKQKIVTYASRLVCYHHPFIFLESAKEIINKRKDIEFYILGNGPLKQDVIDFIHDQNLSNNIIYDFKYDISSILGKTSIYVTLKDDNYPSQSLLEAMACGCSVVATSGGDTYKLVTEKNGVLINLDKQDLLWAILNLFNNKQKLHDFGKISRSLITENYKIENFIEHINSLWFY